MNPPITVAELAAACERERLDPEMTFVLIERDLPVPATEADLTVMSDGAGGVLFGFLIDAADEDGDDDD